jgi:integrase
MTRRRRAGGGVDRLPSGRYRVRVVTPDGRRLSLGTFPTKRTAETAYARAVTEQADGKPAMPTPAATPTLDDYATSWVEARLTSRGEPLRPRVRDLYDDQLRLHILPALGATRIARLTTPRIRDWYTYLRGDHGPGASTAAKCYRLLRSILATAAEDGLIPANPCTIKGAGIEPNEERPIPTVAQAKAIAAAIDARMRCLVLLAAFVGLRKGELLGLRRRDVDLERRQISVVQQRQADRHGNDLVGPPKTDAGVRTLAIPAALVSELEVHLDQYAQAGDDGYVFTGAKGGPLTKNVLQAAWAKSRVKVGLPELHFHDLRHLAGTLAASTGAGTKELMHRLGHASQQAAIRYQHATKERDRSIADAIDRLIDGDVKADR